MPAGETAEPIFGEIIEEPGVWFEPQPMELEPIRHGLLCRDCECGEPHACRFGERVTSRYVETLEDAGIGRERLIYAPFEIPYSQPLQSFTIRWDSAWKQEFPDRAEYFWAKIGGRGPALKERTVNYQEIRFRQEIGGNKFSAVTEVPIRILDPEVNGNTGGMGDMMVMTKLVMIDGDEFQLTQSFGTYMPTGSPKKGLGTGHTAIEPGFLARYKWNELTYVHGDLRFWVPLGGDPVQSGPVIKYGLGLSHLWYDSDTFAVIPTLELVGFGVLDGYATPFDGPLIDVDGQSIVNVHPGVRFVRDGGSALGLFEFGVSGASAITPRHWEQALLRFDLRWSY